jgi:adenosylcobinamide-GDP ribazoletransferase
MRDALRFLTVLPVGSAARPMSAWAAVWFPVVGALLGLLGAAVNQLPAPGRVRALLVLAVWALVTGALHEDGLADTFDACGGGRTREDILRILKDSRIGTYGALALVFSVLLRWEALAGASTATLVACQALPRAGIVALAWLAGPATEGLGGAWAASLRWWHALGAVVIGVGIAGWRAATAAGLCAAVVLLAAWYFRRRLGGITGDCLGAANQIQEVGVLLWLAG